MQQYPYDYVIFQPGYLCRTCLFLKPARSKHCSICNACVAKHDHHCIWIMNCVGKGNYAYFICMLLSIAFLLTYGGYLTHLILTEALQNSFLHPTQEIGSIRQHWSEGITWSEYFEGWLWALTQDVRIGGVGMLAVLTAPLAWGLLLYHVYLIWAGMTTSESAKWADWRDDIADGLVFRSERGRQDLIDGQGNSGIEPYVDWPISSTQSLVRCDNGQKPKGQLDGLGNGADLPARGSLTLQNRWKRVDDLHDVHNLYDLGFWNNAVDAMRTSLVSSPESSRW